MKYIIVILILILVSCSVSASTNDCEKQAKDYQNEHGGDLVLIQPLKDNGAYELGEYSGHWINKAWDKEMGNYYYDSQDKTYYTQISSIKRAFNEKWNKNIAVLNYNKGEVPFGIIWHY